MQTKKVGEILKEERLRQQLTLQQLSDLTRIKVGFLRLLEKNEFVQLPSATYVKGYIKAYSRVFDFDEKPLLALLRRDCKEDTAGHLLPREFLKPISKKRRLWRPVTLVLLTVVSIFLTLFGYVAWQWYNLNRPPRLELYLPEENQFVSSQIVVSGQTEPEAIITINAQPVAIKPDGTFRSEVYLPKEGITTITVEASDRRGKSSLQQRTVYVKF